VEVSDIGTTFEHADPLEVHVRGLSSGNRRVNLESLGCVSSPKSTQVIFIKNQSFGFRLMNSSNTGDLGAVGATQEALPASLINAQLDSFTRL